jgi:hypothetical protein
MSARDEADLRRKAQAWRASRKLPPASPGLPPVLDAEQQEHARHLARRGRMRRQIGPAIATVATILALVSATVLVNDLRGPVGKVRAGGPALPVVNTKTGPVPVMHLLGRYANDQQPACGQADLIETDAGLVLTLNLPYSPDGDEPWIAGAALDALPKGNKPGQISLDVRGSRVTPVPGYCYHMMAALQLPGELRGHPMELQVEVRTDSLQPPSTFKTGPVTVPATQ